MSLQERETRAFFHTYKRLPLEIERGEGVHLFASDGTRYLDMFSGLAVNALGYAHPAVVGAIEQQARRYTHLSNYFLQEPQIRLAELLVEHSGYARVFFANSGTEAVEGALKIARRWGSTQGRSGIVSMSNAFHGRTMGALSIMDRPKYKEGFGPFLDGCAVAEFNDVGSLTASVGSSTAAVILEVIQGEGGIRPITLAFAAALASLQAKHGFLLIADEIQAGVGRTGRFFSFEHFGLTPDLVVVAKPIGGGLPLGVILGGPKVADVLQPGMHGTTFGGNPVACAAGVAVMQEITSGGLMQNAASVGAYLQSELQSLAAEFPGLVREVRGYGLMVGMELSRECEDVATAMRESKHILINCTDRTVLRFLPPLIIGREHVQQTVHALREVLLQG